MADRADQGFEVVPTRIGGSAGPGRSRRRRRAAFVIVTVLVAAIPAIAWVGPRIEWRPEVDLSFLRPTPTAVPSPTFPSRLPTLAPATPLPELTAWAGPHPTEPFAIDVGGLRFVDPTTGAMGPTLGLRGDSDVIFASHGGGWWCVCFVRIQESDRETATVQIRQFDPTGQMTVEARVGDYRSVAAPPSQDFYNRFDLEISPDGRTAYLASGTRTGNQWKLAVEAIDIANGAVVARTELGSMVIPPVPGPTPPPDQGYTENNFSGPMMRMSPDGRELLIWAWVDINSPSGPQQVASPHAWLLDPRQGAQGGPVGRLTSVDGSFATRLRSCYWVAWTKGDELAAICWPTDPGSSTVTLALFGPDGGERGRVDLGQINNWVADPLLDRANRRVLLWQPRDHILQRVDLDSRQVVEIKVDPASIGDAPGPASSPSAPGSGPRSDWAFFSSDMRMGYSPQLIAGPGGSRLFALGVLPENNSSGRQFGSSGIWVFDPFKLVLIDHWKALAAYSSIGLSRDDRWLIAAGVPGFDQAGNEAPIWQSSITVHDITDGRPALQFGTLGMDNQVFQVP